MLNATGVVVHTNLGRAPLAASARAAVAAAAEGYSNLELDLATGERGSRHAHVEGLLREVTGAQAGLAVNNCAAAVLLAAAALAGPGREVVVSRGQLIEIGGGFRIPEVVGQAGARLVEVGTTNRTRLGDYAAALGERTGVILRAHPSNFRTLGFTEEVEIEALCGLGVPVVDDVGSGVLADDVELLADEPAVRRSVRAGAAVVCFSADKLLGGPQGGLLVGTSEAIEACRRHPLARAVRIDKLSLAALEATLALYRDPELARAELPVLAMLDADPGDARGPRAAAGRGLRRRGRRLDGEGRRRRAAAARAARPGGGDRRRPGPAAARRRPAADRPHRRRPAAARRPHAHRRGGRPGGRRRPRRAGMTTAPPLTLGTAGHIDHGKTALVAALTGRDTDRLPAEKARGISIELGYAPLRLPSGRRLSVVDAPGHERFVRTMVAGATGIDLYLMVVAADDGVMPQTREHAAVLAALGVATGVVAVTKADVADPARAAARGERAAPARDRRPVLGAHRRGRRGRARRPRRGGRPPARPRRERRRAAAARRPRLHHPRRRHRGDRHAVGGSDRARRPPASCCRPAPRSGSAPCRSTTSPSSAPTRASASPSTSSASSGATSRAATWSPPPERWRPRWSSTAT